MTTTPRRGFNDAVTRFWSFAAPVYNQQCLQRWVYQPAQDEVIAQLRQRGSRQIADIACGTGILADRIQRELQPDEVYGIDMSDGMLAQARKRSDRVRWMSRPPRNCPSRTVSWTRGDDVGVSLLRSTGGAAGVPPGAGAGRPGGGDDHQPTPGAAVTCALGGPVESRAQSQRAGDAGTVPGRRFHDRRSAPGAPAHLDAHLGPHHSRCEAAADVATAANSSVASPSAQA